MNRSAYLIGIGGAGISGLARYLHQQGYSIYGADPADNATIHSLQNDIQATIFDHHNGDNVPSDCDLLIYSPVVSPDNPERVATQERGIKQYSYPEYLGEISKNKKTIAVAGTNGKTTTTAMIATVLDELGHDPTVIVGGIMPRYGSNFRSGSGDIFVVEACEYKESFLSLYPNITVITNITPDHLDYFGTIDNYIDAFVRLIERMPTDGVLITDTSLPNLKLIIEHAEGRGITIVDYAQYTKHTWHLPIPGEHNIRNASAALVVCQQCGLETSIIQKTIEENFQTADRRFQLLGMTEDGAPVYDDYAHNPEALELLLSGVRTAYPDKKIILVFQPHMFSRTQDFFNEFAQQLSLCDELFLLPIYPARERAEDFDVSSEKLADSITIPVSLPETVADCVSGVQDKNYNAGYIIITAGAGNANLVGAQLVA